MRQGFGHRNPPNIIERPLIAILKRLIAVLDWVGKS
jgi:hypothetical protein